MKGFPRTCDGLLCDEDATLRFRGWWCGSCALKRFGKRDVVLAARFSEIHRALKASEPQGLPSPARTGGTPSEVPSTGRTAVMGTSVGGSLPAHRPPVGEPSAPLSEADLLDILERENWGEPWGS